MGASGNFHWRELNRIGASTCKNMSSPGVIFTLPACRAITPQAENTG